MCSPLQQNTAHTVFVIVTSVQYVEFPIFLALGILQVGTQPSSDLVWWSGEGQQGYQGIYRIISLLLLSSYPPSILLSYLSYHLLLPPLSGPPTVPSVLLSFLLSPVLLLSYPLIIPTVSSPISFLSSYSSSLFRPYLSPILLSSESHSCPPIFLSFFPCPILPVSFLLILSLLSSLTCLLSSYPRFLLFARHIFILCTLTPPLSSYPSSFFHIPSPLFLSYYLVFLPAIFLLPFSFYIRPLTCLAYVSFVSNVNLIPNLVLFFYSCSSPFLLVLGSPYSHSVLETLAVFYTHGFKCFLRVSLHETVKYHC